MLKGHIIYNDWTNEETAEILEMYIGLGMSIKEISEKLNLSYGMVNNQVCRYFKKPKTDMLLQSKINDSTN